jgi:hypothetical protein
MDSQPPPPQPAKLKARSLDDILAEFDSIDQVVFDPVEREQHRDAQPLLPPTFQQPPPHSTTLPYFLHLHSSTLLRLIQIDMQQYKGYIQERKECESGQTYWWKSFIILLEQLYTWESTRSQIPLCTGIQTLIKVLYAQFHAIYLYADINKEILSYILL